MFKHKKLIIWDWNGTLLNDTAVCIGVINRMLKKRNMQAISADHYRSVFRFPVRDYYTDLGFDFANESFEDLTVEFTGNYNLMQHDAALFENSVDLLEEFKRRGVMQAVLSAMEKRSLIDSIRSRGISGYFTTILGIDDHYAAGKIKVAADYLACCPVKRSEIIFLGDTTHDYEVSQNLGIDCLLVSNGHQSHQILLKTGIPVQKNLSNVLNMLLNS